MGMNMGSRARVLNEINVTPLVDVMLVLLIIFMVTAPMMQQGFDVNLPEAAGTGIETKEDPFVLSIRKSGKVYLGKTPTPQKELRSKLAAIFETRKNKQIYIQADQAVPYGTVAATMGEIKAAGIHNISLVTIPKSN